MTHMITRCPACGTCFRITEAQLNTAKGAVRCGSCLQIFRALENRVDLKKPHASSPAPAKASAGPKPSSQQTQQPVSAPDQAALFSPAEPEPEPGPAKPSPAPSFQDASLGNPAAEEDDFDDDILISDEMPLGDDDSEGEGSSFSDGLSVNFLELGGWTPSSKSLFEREPKAPTDEDEDEQEEPDESWAISLLEDEHEELTTAEPRPDDAEDEGTEQSIQADSYQIAIDQPAPEPELDESGNEEEEEEFADYEPSLGSAIDEFDELFDGQGEKLVRERRSLLSSIQPEPVVFSSYQGRNWRGMLLWGGLSVLGLLALIGQIAWFQFDTLSRHQPYRSFYTSLCPLFQCEVPPLAAPELIRTSNLVVRTHPQVEGALVVDTILLNTASFRQPFPELTLTFSDRHGQTVASRRFQPHEYLAGELAGHQVMPSNQPIHLTLEIEDPGPDAVSYSAYIP